MKLKFKNGGIVRLQPGGSIWNQISNPRQTYTDGYGVKRPVNESKAITIGRKAYNTADRFFNGPSKEWYEERGMSKPNASAGVLGLFTPSMAGSSFYLGEELMNLSKAINKERAAKVIAFRSKTDPNYLRSIQSMKNAMKMNGDAQLAADLKALETYGATNVEEFKQFEEMMNKGFDTEKIMSSLKPRVKMGDPRAVGIFESSGHIAKEGQQMVPHSYISGIGNYKLGGMFKKLKLK